MMQPEREGRLSAVGAVSSLHPVEGLPPGAFDDAVFKVAFVCTANQFRSALAEAVCTYLLAGAPAEVSSFGVLDRTGSPPLRPAVDVAKQLGIDLSGHRSRALKPGSLAGTNLVVGFERSHVAAAVVEGGAAPERTFLLTELVQLLLAAGAGTTLTDPTPDELVRRLDPARRLHGYGEFPSIRDQTSAAPIVQRAVAVKVSEYAARAILTLFASRDDKRADELLARIEKLKKKADRRRFGLWGASNTQRAAAQS